MDESPADIVTIGNDVMMVGKVLAGEVSLRPWNKSAEGIPFLVRL